MDVDNKGWVILFTAGLMEIVWAVCMGYSEGFRLIQYDILVIVFLALSMYLLAKALNCGIPVGTGYAVWTGIGSVGTMAVSLLTGVETATALKLLFIAMIIIGIVGLQLSSKSTEE